nr:photosystem II protein I [Sycopsis sinensis]YP_010689308.1 photosystem II protein I [Distyliopsis dunnii]YP_010689482.1 photosystem II protein I [Eustigma oblongifolium]WBR73107.1 photosystem II protein I [Hamamelis mollis]WBR73629.1 photosystem II protein I [Distylium racemosum]WBR73803.1 photosystem II protein I [Distylium buxifolium]WBR74064.1 photosystem II protein I [Distylium pingpienense]WBR74499.1 photosystem II protein I [Distylium dunnianum]WBR75282.1 photosystem II protein I [
MKMENLFSFFPQKRSWRLCNAYSQTLCLHSSDILCFSLHLRIPI